MLFGGVMEKKTMPDKKRGFITDDIQGKISYERDIQKKE
jgi:hypothetical protein